MIHYDVMDGTFVPNIMLGTCEFSDIHEVTDLSIDLHLMCINPDVAVDYFDVRKNDRVCFHPQTVANPASLLKKIKCMGALAGIALSPKTPIEIIEELAFEFDYILLMSVEPGFAGQKILPEAFDKIRSTANLRAKIGMDFDILVDGNCNPENVKKMIDNGANQFVIGSALLNDTIKAEDFCDAYKSYKNEIGN